jgi:P-type E1-E2 ATPase
VRLIAAEQMVPGDIVVLEAGDAIPADLRLIEASNLAADESTLTGESVAVDKATHRVAARTIARSMAHLRPPRWQVFRPCAHRCLLGLL